MTKSIGNEPRDHHYAPQFFLRNFALDTEKRRITTVSKHGQYAVWEERALENVGFERDFYIHHRHGVPFSVETVINRAVETPLSASETWLKIRSGQTDALDRADKAVLYSLIRHMEARTPVFLNNLLELTRLAGDDNCDIPFSDEEREMFSFIRADPNRAKLFHNHMTSSLEWTENTFKGAHLTIVRSKVPLRSSTIPVVSMSAPDHPALALPLPGMVPYQLVLTLNWYTLAILVLGNFDDGFANVEIDDDVTRVLNRRFTHQFSHVGDVRHLITQPDRLEEDMLWAGFKLGSADRRRLKFRRSP